MRKPLVVKPPIFAKLSSLPVPDRNECWDALLQLAETFGRPHVHSGIGIRKMGRCLFECRANRSLRFLFLDLEDSVEVCFLGNHDEVQKALKTGKYD